ncbi:unnamed protein product [Diamesa serratosioi]
MSYEGNSKAVKILHSPWRNSSSQSSPVIIKERIIDKVVVLGVGSKIQIQVPIVTTIKTEDPKQSGAEYRGTGSHPPEIRRWVPPTLRPQHGLTEEAKRDEIFRKVRGILNKLTPEKFLQLSDDLLSQNLNSPKVLNGVIHLIFEKALDEPKYSSMYAQLCKRLSEEAPNFETEPDNKCTFLRLLLSVCRDKFENRSQFSEKIYAATVQTANDCEPDDEERKHVAKQKILGNVKFIGELFKLDMLSESVLHKMLERLLDKKSRSYPTLEDRCDDIECLSAIFRTCGKNLDTEKSKKLIDQYFDIMEYKSNSSKYPARIRFLLRDVIELRKELWQPRKILCVEGPMPIQELSTDEDIIRQQRDYRTRTMDYNRKNNDRDSNNWMSKLPIHLQNMQSNYGTLTMSAPTITSPNINNNKHHRDGGSMNNGSMNSGSMNSGSMNSGSMNSGMGGMGGGYNNHNNNGHHMNNQNNNSSFNNANNMLNNKDLAPRFKRTLVPAPQSSVEDLQMRPAQNSLLSKAMNIKPNQLPLHTQSPQTRTMSGGGFVTKQGSIEKPGKAKKDKGPSREEVLKTVSQFITETLLDKKFIENHQLVQDIIMSMDGAVKLFYDLKVPDKFLKDAITKIVNESLDQGDSVHEIVIEFLQLMRKERKLQSSQLVEAYRGVINGMSEREKTIPKVTTLVASLLSRAINMKICKLSDVANFANNGQYYPLLLLVLQQQHKSIGKDKLIEVFNVSKINLMNTLPEADRTKDRMAEILDDRKLNFLAPLLRIESELWKQIQTDAQPQTFYKWIKENVDSQRYTDPGFITALMTVLLRYISQETTFPEGNDPSKAPEKAAVDSEKKLLDSFSRILVAFLNGHLDLQLIAIYALQVYCFQYKYPKGLLLRWFTALYELEIIEEDAFLRWKEDITEIYPGKGTALFQVNSWLTWLEEAESEDDEDE